MRPYLWPRPGIRVEPMNNIPPGSIVVAADGSADADRAVQWAAEQAFLARRGLVVLTAARETFPLAAAGVGAAYVYPVEDVLARAAEVAHVAAQLAIRHRPGLSVQSLAVGGDPASVIVDHTTNADLVVLGSRGRGRVTSRALGSVSSSVTRHASCPVVVCRPGSDLKVKRGVVVGVDGTPDSLPVIDFAFRQAALRAQPLTVLHCHWDALAAIGGAGLARPDDFEVEPSRLALAESIAGFREEYPDVYTTTQVAHGLPADSLAAVADRYNLVVVGRHPVESVARRVSPATATSVLERCHTAVAMVPEAVSVR